jgi:hypothetical protein
MATHNSNVIDCPRFAKIAAAFLILLFFWGLYTLFLNSFIASNSGDIFSVITTLVVLLFIVVLIKFFESVFVYRIEFNQQNNEFIFGFSTGKKIIKVNDIAKWRTKNTRIVVPSGSHGGSSGTATSSRFECILKDGTCFYYPGTLGKAKFFQEYFASKIPIQPMPSDVSQKPIIFENHTPSIIEKIRYQLISVLL